MTLLRLGVIHWLRMECSDNILLLECRFSPYDLAGVPYRYFEAERRKWFRESGTRVP